MHLNEARNKYNCELLTEIYGSRNNHTIKVFSKHQTRYLGMHYSGVDCSATRVNINPKHD